jgi:glycolate oxidase
MPWNKALSTLPVSSNKSSPALRKLKRALGSVVFTDPESLAAASFDGLKIAFSPEAVIRPEKADQVGHLLRLAYREEVPVTTRGAGSSLTGSAAPVRNGWVLDLSRLNQFVIDPLNRIARVGAGTVTAELQAAVREQGLFYPPDPSSHKWCTIGGNIACNAGGLRCTKYGVTRDYVLGLEGFMPDGTPVKWGAGLRKFSTGYNVRDLWIGSEGTLGVITGATLKLILAPATQKTFLLAFKTELQALDAVQVLFSRGGQPSICEFLDRLSVKGAEGRVGHPIFAGKPGRALLLVEVDGSVADVKEQGKLIRSWADTTAEAWQEAKTPAAVETLWEARRKCSGAMFQLGPNKLNEDVSVPLDRQKDLFRAILRIRKESGLPIAVFGHAGDGNLHVNIMYDRNDSAIAHRAEAAVEEVMKTVVSLDGAISGEHGVGLAKSPFLSLQFPQSEIEIMKKLKNTLDPKGLLNPGKIFEPFPVWEHAPVKVDLPWDHR